MEETIHLTFRSARVVIGRSFLNLTKARSPLSSI